MGDKYGTKHHKIVTLRVIHFDRAIIFALVGIKMSIPLIVLWTPDAQNMYSL